MEIRGQTLSIDKDLNDLTEQLRRVQLDVLRGLIEPEEFKAWAKGQSNNLTFGADKEKALTGIAELFFAQKSSAKTEVSLVLLAIDQKYFYHLPEQTSDDILSKNRTEQIIDLIRQVEVFHSEILYGGHNSGLDHDFMLEYFPNDRHTTFLFLDTLADIPELKTEEFIVPAWKEIGMATEAPDSWKNLLFSHYATPQMLDNESFFIRCLQEGISNWGDPLRSASSRIKSDKNAALILCNLDGSVIAELDPKFKDDRDLALITLSNAPRYFDWFSDEIKADPYIDAFKSAVARYIGN